MFMKTLFTIFRKKHKGFTLVESIMALAIFLIMGMVIFVTLNGILEIIREGIASVESKLNVERLAYRLKKEVAPLTVIDRAEVRPGEKVTRSTFIFWDIYVHPSKKPLAAFTNKPTDENDRLMVARRMSYRLVSSNERESGKEDKAFEKDTDGIITVLERREELFH